MTSTSFPSSASPPPVQLPNASSAAELLEDPCAYSPPPYLEERFWLVSVFGTSVAIISICENFFLLFMFARSRLHRNSHSLYLLLLAFCDIFISAAYIPLMSFSLLLDYFESLILLRAWFTYMVPMITVSHVAISSSSFLIVVASFERYCITVNSKMVRVLHKYRKQIGVGAILLGVFTKISLALEFDIDVNEECKGTMNEYSLGLSSFATNRMYNLLWRLWFRSIVTVLCPFFLLAFINSRIVLVLQRSEFVQLLHLEKISEVQRKISIATILAGALRLPIYVTCQPQLRKEFRDFFKKLVVKEKIAEDSSSNHSTTPYVPMLVRITDLLLKYPALGRVEKLQADKHDDSDFFSEDSELSCDDDDDRADLDGDGCFAGAAGASGPQLVVHEGGEVFL